jgi:hypothetical protein
MKNKIYDIIHKIAARQPKWEYLTDLYDHLLSNTPIEYLNADKTPNPVWKKAVNKYIDEVYRLTEWNKNK